MNTCCPACQTIFELSAAELNVRAGNVRCAQCRLVFDAKAHLCEDAENEALPTVLPTSAPIEATEATKTENTASTIDKTPAELDKQASLPPDGQKEHVTAELNDEPHEVEPTSSPTEEASASSETTRTDPERTKTSDSDLAPLLTTRFEPSSGPSSYAPFEQSERSLLATSLWFAFAFILILVFAGQAIFYWRGDIAVRIPALRPVFESLSQRLGLEMYYPSYAEQISIEVSHLEKDSDQPNLLILSATLRNRANFAQAFPALEVSLTDPRDEVLVRRILLAPDYLPEHLKTRKLFAANTDISIRLWIDTGEITAAGYRLYAFYP